MVIPNSIRSEKEILSYHNNYDVGKRPIPASVFLFANNYSWFEHGSVRTLTFIQEAIEGLVFKWETEQIYTYGRMAGCFPPYGFKSTAYENEHELLSNLLFNRSMTFHPDIASYVQLRHVNVESIGKVVLKNQFVYQGINLKTRQQVVWDDLVLFMFDSQFNPRIKKKTNKGKPPIKLSLRTTMGELCQSLVSKDCLHTLEIFYDPPRNTNEWDINHNFTGAFEAISNARHIANKMGIDFRDSPSVESEVNAWMGPNFVTGSQCVQNFNIGEFKNLEKFSLFPSSKFSSWEYGVVFNSVRELKKLKEVSFVIYDLRSLHVLSTMLPPHQYTKCCVTIPELRSNTENEREGQQVADGLRHLRDFFRIPVDGLVREMLHVEGDERAPRPRGRNPAVFRERSISQDREALRVEQVTHLRVGMLSFQQLISLFSPICFPNLKDLRMKQIANEYDPVMVRDLLIPPDDKDPCKVRPEILCLEFRFISSRALEGMHYALPHFNYVRYLSLSFKIKCNLPYSAHIEYHKDVVEVQVRNFLARARELSINGKTHEEVISTLEKELYEASLKRYRKVGSSSKNPEDELDPEIELDYSHFPNQSSGKEAEKKYRLSDAGLLFLLKCPSEKIEYLFDTYLQRLIGTQRGIPYFILGNFCYWEVLFNSISEMKCLEFLDLPGNECDRVLTSYRFYTMVKEPTCKIKQVTFNSASPPISFNPVSEVRRKNDPYSGVSTGEKHVLEMKQIHCFNSVISSAYCRYGPVDFKNFIKAVVRPQTSEVQPRCPILTSFKTYMIDIEGWRQKYSRNLVGKHGMDYNYRSYDNCRVTQNGFSHSTSTSQSRLCTVNDFNEHTYEELEDGIENFRGWIW
ncbi:uncharacterized protein SAPINGB_P004384 [Magnusiomyces paraingens]|uniref:Uncharacterized protein n=1 Tax=Magnusiomyces paraingens TaxID=2606893 RepID=A0A5E8BZB5_9ASCO|nr:uncharacterized protein SAPINGB_P004384 [Saprochaete ingens]VVT55030.1 unnamed protein product [Saprochaete ingens]